MEIILIGCVLVAIASSIFSIYLMNLIYKIESNYKLHNFRTDREIHDLQEELMTQEIRINSLEVYRDSEQSKIESLSNEQLVNQLKKVGLAEPILEDSYGRYI